LSGPTSQTLPVPAGDGSNGIRHPRTGSTLIAEIEWCGAANEDLGEAIDA
jgi:hypothetical protein